MLVEEAPSHQAWPHAGEGGGVLVEKAPSREAWPHAGELRCW